MESNDITLALCSDRIVTCDGVVSGAVLIAHEMIAGIVDRKAIPRGVECDEYGSLALLPGLVDTHVHINEPGRTEWEGFETATRAAAAGGITTVVDMPLNCSPVTTNAKGWDVKLVACRGKLQVDCGFHGGLIPGNTNDIPSLIERGALGVKAFLVHSGMEEFPNVHETDLHAAMPLIAAGGVPLLVHAESGESFAPSSRRYADYLASRPRAMEHEAIELLIRLCREYNCPVHIVHLSSADAVPALRAAKKEGLPLSVETCPHYLALAAEEIADGDTRFKCAPPIRENANRGELWNALAEGVIDFIVSDHSPCPPGMKHLDTGDFSRAWGGIASLQFGLPLVWTEASKRGYSLSDVVDWMSTKPARLVALERRKGAIAVGHDADIVVFDPDTIQRVGKAMIHHRHKITPYEGRELKGNVLATYLRGRKVYNNGFFPDPCGAPLLRRHHVASVH